MAMRHVLQRIKVPVIGGDFDPAAPTAGAVEHQGSGVRDIDPIDVELVVVETLVLRRRRADPDAVGTLGHGVLHAADIELHGLCLRGA